jgi:ubiquitin-conjugating enzyme E2 variant
MTIVSAILQILGILLLVDFFSGFFHWMEDTYFTESTPLIGRLVVAPNVIHHHSPREFTKSPLWRRNLVTAVLGGVIFAGGSLLFGASWQLGLFCLIGSLCNEFHCWAHRTSKENGPVISFLHACRILQTPIHYSVHHTDPKTRAYCVLTNFLNPVLDGLGFWRRLETIVICISGIRPRPDESVAVDQVVESAP